MKLEDNYRCERGKGESTCPAYSVEAKHTSGPVNVGGQLFDGEWRNVSFQESFVGVPNSSSPVVTEHGLLGYASAQALRWWVHAASQADFGSGGFCLDTRIVKHIIKTTYEITAVSAHEIVGDDDNPNHQPAIEKQEPE